MKNIQVGITLRKMLFQWGKNERLLNLKNGVWTPFLKNFTKKIKKLLRLSEFSV